MLYYPQLTSGSVAQYPVNRRNQRRTIANTLADGSNIPMEDATFASVGWDLTYAHLTADEATSIENLFLACEGRLGTFTFLDPTDNLLNWTEDFTQKVWEPDPLLTVSGGVADPFGGSSGAQLTNTAQITQVLSQNIAGASWFQYCLSVWIRADVPTPVTLVAASSGSSAQQSFNAAPAWMRAVFASSLNLQQDGVKFGIQLAPGTRVYIYGPQMEAQLGAGNYKRSTNLAGVYPHSRFDSDELAVTATGLNQYACKVSIVSCTAG